MKIQKTFYRRWRILGLWTYIRDGWRILGTGGKQRSHVDQTNKETNHGVKGHMLTRLIRKPTME